MKKITIYLSGGIKKGKNDEKKSCFNELIKSQIREKLKNYEIRFLDPNDAPPNLSDAKAVFGCDLLRVKLSDFVLVDAREKRGIGVGQEMLFAKLNKIPVISVAPKNSHYLRKNLEYLGQKIDEFVHPFIFGPSDAIVETFEDAANRIKDFIETPKQVKGIECVEYAINHYKNTQSLRHKSVKEVLEEKS
ncbi:MAG: hypothetical protein KAT91_01835 [Candidatus Aenigmarchaeota archaeon]|nr:hypothetical protein [Candidatus Aenigmarchaeota archaeon]